MNENPNEELIKLSELCWQFRKDQGYTKSLPAEYKKQALEILFSGTRPSHISKYLGIPAHSLKDWKKSYENQKIKAQTQPEKNYFTEVKTESDLSTKTIVDKSQSVISISFEKNGIHFEIKNLSIAELVQIMGLG